MARNVERPSSGSTSLFAMTVQSIPLSSVDPHPDNPRLELRTDVIASIRHQLAHAPYDEAHAILVRPLNDRYQILSGHHRVEAARGAGLAEIPAWVREYSDEEAYMHLMLSNIQSGLKPLERGRHAKLATTKYGVNGGTSLVKYAERIGRVQQSIHHEVVAYEVYAHVQLLTSEKTAEALQGYFAHLVVIHAAADKHWHDLCQRMVNEKWSRDTTEREVRLLRPKRAVTTKKKKAETKAVTLTEWKTMSADQQAEILDWRECGYSYRFNDQKTDNVEWARSSHNPVTGCLHNCPYCYAREIAERIYPEKFEPVLHVDRLCAPYMTPVPPLAAQDISFKNVFMCSMADLFGQWVPKEWIEAVLQTVRENPQWNFLFLTKFPIRMAEFEYPDNAWLGTTVDLQARVKNAERAMQKVKASVKWLSLEPLIEPLHFEDLSAFNWVVIGGASEIKRSSTGETPAWRPPWKWVWDLSIKAQNAGCLVYHKTNLNHDRVKEFPGDPNAQPTTSQAPTVFHYLKTID